MAEWLPWVVVALVIAGLYVLYAREKDKRHLAETGERIARNNETALRAQHELQDRARAAGRTVREQAKDYSERVDEQIKRGDFDSFNDS